jgi:hypothetical protein
VIPPVQPDPPETGRPDDVSTGFWLWVLALPLLVAGYVVDVASAPGPIVAFSAVFVVGLAAVVLTFLFLMRAGYRWARTVLTAGALTTAFYTVNGLFTVQRDTGAALVYAGTGIIGIVLLAGGIFLLHRKNANAYFVR